jgi:hypothetical protein
MAGLFTNAFNDFAPPGEADTLFHADGSLYLYSFVLFVDAKAEML